MSDHEASVDDRAAWRLAQRRLVLAGTVAAVLAVLASGAAYALLPILLGERTQLWAVVAIAAAAAMLAVCVMQHSAWRRGDLSADRRRLSWAIHVISYVVTLLTLVACLSAAAAAGLGSVAAGLWAFELILVLVAQVTAGVQYLREDGPPGTVPAHVRELRAWIKRSQEREDDLP
jgi:O-antigen/teichoic acid export membrane protein